MHYSQERLYQRELASRCRLKVLVFKWQGPISPHSIPDKFGISGLSVRKRGQKSKQMLPLKWRWESGWLSSPANGSATQPSGTASHIIPPILSRYRNGPTARSGKVEECQFSDHHSPSGFLHMARLPSSHPDDKDTLILSSHSQKRKYNINWESFHEAFKPLFVKLWFYNVDTSDTNGRAVENVFWRYLKDE